MKATNQAIMKIDLLIKEIDIQALTDFLFQNKRKKYICSLLITKQFVMYPRTFNCCNAPNYH